MTKRKILIHFVVVFTIMIQSSSYAQNTITKVAYKEYFDTDRPIQRSAYLYTDGKTSIYEQDLKSTEPWKKIEVDENTVTILPDIKYNDQIKIDHTQKKISFFRQLQKDDFYLIEDNFNNPNWKLKKETKVIAGYKCHKATREFRGRKWIVWYAPELNFSAGPWKLYRLPGLILEAHDETHRYTFSAEKITFEKSDILDKDFTSFRNEKLKNATLKDFLNMQESSREAAFSRLSNNRGSVQRTSFPRSGMELIYEWEEESSEK